MCKWKWILNEMNIYCINLILFCSHNLFKNEIRNPWLKNRVSKSIVHYENKLQQLHYQNLLFFYLLFFRTGWINHTHMQFNPFPTHRGQHVSSGLCVWRGIPGQWQSLAWPPQWQTLDAGRSDKPSCAECWDDSGLNMHAGTGPPWWALHGCPYLSLPLTTASPSPLNEAEERVQVNTSAIKRKRWIKLTLKL